MDTNLIFKTCHDLFSIPKTIMSSTWYTIQGLWPFLPWLILLVIGIWILFEIKTRNGNWHWNAKNGFSKYFNSFVGSGTYALLQAISYFILTFIFGNGIYCFGWPLILHYIVYRLTSKILNATGFWLYEKQPSTKPKFKYRKKRY